MQTEKMNILMTGATGGIGQAFVKKAYAEGANLVLVGRNKQRLETLVQELKQQASSGQIILAEADIMLDNDRHRLVKLVQELPFAVNTLINNAGTNQFSLLTETSEEDISSIITTNTLAPILLSKALIPHLSQQGSAQIINVGSTFGSIGYPGYSCYCASKYALRGFSEALRRELATTNIRVKYLSPRATKTALNNSHVESMNQELNVAMDSAELVADKMLVLLTGQRDSLFIGLPEKIFAFINQIFPSIVGNSIIKQLPVITRYARLSAQAPLQASKGA